MKKYADKDKKFIAKVGEWLYEKVTNLKKDKDVNREVVEIAEEMAQKLIVLLQSDKTTGESKSGVKYDLGVTQKDINDYVDAAYLKQNTEDYIPYSTVSKKLVSDVSNEINISGYVHALRDNDIRHIRNSHGESTNEKYPVTKQDIANIPYIVSNYDKVFVKYNANNDPGLIYVKVGPNNVIYYVEAVTQMYHNRKLLVNKQMIKAGIDEIPNLVGFEKAINKKESSSQYLADLQEIRKAYVQDVKENYPTNSIHQNEPDVNTSEEKNIAKADLREKTSAAKRDSEYLSAVERGDMETAQSFEAERRRNEI